MTVPDSDTEGAVATDGGHAVPGQATAESSALPLKRGAIVGAAAYAATFVVTYVLVLIDAEGNLGMGTIEGYQVVGWLFYNAHSVELSMSAAGVGLPANLLEAMYSGGADTTVPKLVFYAVPVVVLVVAGMRVARSVDAPGFSNPTEGAKAGATVAVGYVALGVVGALTVFSFTESGFGQTVTIAPELGGAVLFFAAYAVVAGGIGGYVSAQ